MLKSFFNKVIFWLDNARFYSSAMTVLSWVVAFLYSLKNGGSAILGVVALLGILPVHWSTNLIDDYFDYKILSKDEKYMASAQDCKCKYLKSSMASLGDLKRTILIMLSFSALIGLFLFIKSGFYVVLLALVALVIAFIYQTLSIKGLGEIAVIIAYGPLMYEGVYYVMTGKFSINILVLSFACASLVNTVLYNHMLMDYDGDECSHKTTLCRKFGSKQSALNFGLLFYIIGYFLISVISFKTSNFLYLLCFLTLPMVVDIYRLLKNYNEDKTQKINVHFWHYPLDNWDKIKDSESANFYFLFFYSRNIVTYFMLMIAIAVLFS